jgi:hypothetical protein
MGLVAVLGAGCAAEAPSLPQLPSPLQRTHPLLNFFFAAMGVISTNSERILVLDGEIIDSLAY